MATPPKRRKQYMRPGEPYLIPASTLRYQATVAARRTPADSSPESLDGDEDRVILGYSDNSDSSEADDQQRVNVDSDSGDGFSDNFDANEGDDREASVDREIGDASSDGECASENRIDETENSADAEDLDEEVLRPESLEDFLASEHSDDDEVGAGSIEDFLTLISEEYGASTLPHSPTTKAGAIAMIMSYAVSERMTWTGLGKQLKLVNMLFGCTVVPETTYKLRKLWSSKTNKLVKYHYLCPSCGTVLDTDCTHARCSACLLEETTTKLKREGSYFLMLDLHDQLEHLIAKTKDELHSSLLDITSSSNDVITDITTGEAYKRLRQEVPLSPNDITITFNTDGSPIFKSSKTSVWPIQFTVNELPPSVRLHHSTLAGLWFGKCHPDMSAFMEKFVDEVNNMTPVTWMHGDHSHTSKAFVVCCSVDAPARAAVQNMVLFNGFFGCPWCLMKGEHEEGCVRYVSDEAPAPRTSELVARDMVLALRLGSPVNGIKGPSALMNLEGFDLVAGMSVEYMHCVLQGVVRQITELLFSSTSSRQAFYIGARQSVAKVDIRLRSIRPPHCITRLPRSIEERGFWKASEWRQWLLFYALPCLLGVLPQLYWRHLCKLSEAVHILLQDSLTLHDIKRAEELLQAFVGRVEALYGVGAMTFNMHLLLHLANSVRSLGPLWAHSAFVFEGGNGKLKSLVSAAKGLPQQVVERVVMAQELELLLATHQLPSREESICRGFLDYLPIRNASRVDESTMLGSGQAVVLSTCEKVALQQHCGASVHKATEYQRCVVKSQVFHSTAYTRAVQSDSSVVSTHDGSFFKILKILKVVSLDGPCCVLLCRSVVLRESPYFPQHIKECFLSELQSVCCVEPSKLKSSCVYIEFLPESKSFICELPNMIERD